MESAGVKEGIYDEGGGCGDASDICLGRAVIARIIRHQVHDHEQATKHQMQTTAHHLTISHLFYLLRS